MTSDLMKKQVGNTDVNDRARRACLVQSHSSVAICNEYGFSTVTSADWFWELFAWGAMCLVIQTQTSFSFLLIWALWHNSKARERHLRYVV